MGICRYCGQPAGFLRSAHYVCKRSAKNAQRETANVVARFAGSGSSNSEMEQALTSLVKESRLSNAEERKAIIAGFSRGVASVLEDGVLTRDEENRLVELKNRYELTDKEIGSDLTRVIKLAMLRDLGEGKVPNRLDVEGDLSFILQRGETVVWIMNRASFYRLRPRSTWVGASRGVSFRVMKGVYCRMGTSRGEKIVTQELIKEGEGTLIITNKNIVFSSATFNLKIPLKKVLTVKPFSDGIEIVREAANPKPQYITVDDPWFATNLVLRLGSL